MMSLLGWTLVAPPPISRCWLTCRLSVSLQGFFVSVFYCFLNSEVCHVNQDSSWFHIMYESYLHDRSDVSVYPFTYLGALRGQEALDSLAGPSLHLEPCHTCHVTAHLTEQSVLPQHQTVLKPLTDLNSPNGGLRCDSRWPI